MSKRLDAVDDDIATGVLESVSELPESLAEQDDNDPLRAAANNFGVIIRSVNG